MCISCREMRSKEELHRIIRTKEGTTILAKDSKICGRSAYICKNKECLKKAYKRGSVNKSLHIDCGNEIIESLIKEMEAD